MTCVEVMYHQPFSSPFSSSSYPGGGNSRSRGSSGVGALGAGVIGSNGFSSGHSLSRMHHEPLNLGHTAPSLSTSSSALSSSSSIAVAAAAATGPPSSSSLSSSSPFLSSTLSSLSTPSSSYYPATSFLLTPSSSTGPPSGNTSLISPTPSLLTSPQLPPQQPQPQTPPISSSPLHHHHHQHQESSILSSSPASASSSTQSNSASNHHLNFINKNRNDSTRSNLDTEYNSTEPKGAQYLTGNCVLFTYRHGSVGEQVDEHFARALSEDNNNGHDSSSSSGRQGESNPRYKQTGSKVPMSARNFPPSFWDSSYYQNHHQHHNQQQQQHHNVFSSYHRNLQHQHQQHHHLPHNSSGSSAGTTSDMGLHSTAHYFSPALHGFSNLQSDAWGYGLSSSATGMSYPPHMPYDLSGYSSASRFGQNYNPFLMQPSVVRPNPFSAVPGAGHSDITKEHSRSSRFADHRLGADYGTHPSFTAIDSLQEATKDLYWF